VLESLAAIEPIIAHAVDILRGTFTDHVIPSRGDARV
jgi:hypothetical protein